jgi:hypothetical protein
MRTEGAECESNAVDAEAMLRFTLGTLRQLVDRRGNRDRLRALLEERARRDRTGPSGRAPDHEATLSAKLSELKGQLEVAGRRMAQERDDARYEAIAREYDRLHREVRATEAALESERRASAPRVATTIQDEVDAALSLLDDIERITADDGARAEIHPMLEALGLRIGLTFGGAIKGRARVVRRLLGGVVSFNGAPLPVRLHGPDNREAIDEPRDSSVRQAQGDVEGELTESHDEPAGRGGVASNPADRSESSGCRVGIGAVEGGDRFPGLTAGSQREPIRPGSRRPEGISITKVNRGERI